MQAGLVAATPLCGRIIGPRFPAHCFAGHGRMNPRYTSADQFPPVAPTGETAAPPDPSFVEQCLANEAHVAKPKQWQLGTQLLTQNDRWGLVWWADFTIPDTDE